MKSIKEQADYLYQGYGTNPNRKVLRENFIQGANYVLDAIIECLPKTHSFNPDEVIDIIMSRIKELKK